jgi:hypothetical protein
MKLQAVCCFKTSVNFCQTAWLYIPEDSILYKLCCENFKSSDVYIE